MHPRVYKLGTMMAAPLMRAVIACQPRYRPLAGRFHPTPPRAMTKPIWVHACSVGELNTATPLLRAIESRWPDRDVLLTVSTVSAHAIAREGIGRDRLAWFPVDSPTAVNRAFDAYDPSALILVETELWPNVIHEAHTRGVPVSVVNGRISAKHFPRMQRMGAVGKRMMNELTCIAAQDENYADRFQMIGAAADRVHITGNIKFDAVAHEADPAKLEIVDRVLDESDAPLIVFGSTRPGDERLAIETWEALRKTIPGVRLAIVPRHIERSDEIAGAIEHPTYRRSRSDDAAGENDVILVDTFGELIAWYARATVAVVGGSFFPGVEGHNPIEPAALGIPTVFGPYMGNFREAAEMLIEAKGAVQVESPTGLAPALVDLLQSADTQETLGINARKTVESGRGALERTLQILASVL